MTTCVPVRPSVEAQTPLWSLDAIHQEYSERIFHYIKHLVTDPCQAEDLTQEVFLRAWKALPRMGADLKLSPWLYRIATNAAYDVLRHRRLIEWHSLEALSVEPESREHGDPQVQYSGPSELIRQALSQMKPRHREALVLYYGQGGSSYAQVAQMMGISPSSIKMHLLRARKQFREAYLSQQKEGKP